MYLYLKLYVSQSKLKQNHRWQTKQTGKGQSYGPSQSINYTFFLSFLWLHLSTSVVSLSSCNEMDRSCEEDSFIQSEVNYTKLSQAMR